LLWQELMTVGRAQEAGVQLPSRFDDADVELMRYAGTAGLLRASPEGRPAVAAKSARAVQATTEWLAGHEFLTDNELQRWDDLVRASCASHVDVIRSPCSAMQLYPQAGLLAVVLRNPDCL
jgi:hypothetical protein